MQKHIVIHASFCYLFRVFSPLLVSFNGLEVFVCFKVTNFECGGYSIGISCSLLLAEMFIIENFLGKWAEIHNNISSQHEKNLTPIFYRPRLKNHEPLPSDIISRTQSQNGVQSMVFKITTNELNINKELLRELAMLCVDEAEQKLGTNLGSNISLVLKESYEAIKVESCSMNEWSVNGLKHEIIPTTWNEFGVYEVAFNEGNRPVKVCCWVGFLSDGYAMAVPLPCLKENACAVVVASPTQSSQ